MKGWRFFIFLLFLAICFIILTVLMLIYFYTAPKYKYVPEGYEANKEIGCKPFVTESTLIKTTKLPLCVMNNLVTSFVTNTESTSYNGLIESTSSKVDIVSTSIAAKAKSTMPSLSIKSTPENNYQRIIYKETRMGETRRSTNSKPISREKFLNDVLTVHNYYRNLHHVPPLKLSDELNKHAADRAQRIIEDPEAFDIKPVNRYGEIVLLLTGSTDVNGKEAVESWASESEHVKDFSPDVSTPLTQVIWKSTELLGCAFEVNIAIKRVVIDCLYSPTGNVDTQFKENLFPRSQT